MTKRTHWTAHRISIGSTRTAPLVKRADSRHPPQRCRSAALFMGGRLRGRFGPRVGLPRFHAAGVVRGRAQGTGTGFVKCPPAEAPFTPASFVGLITRGSSMAQHCRVTKWLFLLALLIGLAIPAAAAM